MVRQIRAADPADVRFVWSSSGISVDSVNYYGSLVFENGQLSKGLFDGGYVEQVNHYYAFGGLMGESTGGDTQRFKYNGKELDRMSGLDWYDYGARHYDAMTVEEKRVIEGIESFTAACLGEINSGEITRNDHSGRPFDTSSSISNRELNPMDIIVFPK